MNAKTVENEYMKSTQRININEVNELTGKVIGLAINVHKNLGPGFAEKIYERALAEELNTAGINYSNQETVSINYNNTKTGKQQLDFIIDDILILEIKSATRIIPIFEDQLISYLKGTGKKIGLILNFGRKKLEIKRLVNGL